jgi:hypothetical protein
MNDEIVLTDENIAQLRQALGVDALEQQFNQLLAYANILEQQIEALGGQPSVSVRYQMSGVATHTPVPGNLRLPTPNGDTP